MTLKIKTPYLRLPSTDSTLALPLYSSKISAGFPSPADDYVDSKIDLHRLLIKNRPATFIVKVEGDSMKNIGLFNNDLLIIDNSLTPTHNKIVIACINGELLVKRYCIEKGEILLKAENEAYKPIKIEPEDDFTIVGIVTGLVRTDIN